jgi:hypothetical protein
MTMLDLRPERPRLPTETRQLGELGRASTDQLEVSSKVFWIAVAVIAALLAVYAVTR